MDSITALFQERCKDRELLLSGGRPSRVPVYAHFTLEAACGFAGIDLTEAQYDTGLCERAYEKICENFYSDELPARLQRFPLVYQILNAQNWKLASNGVLQHPEIEIMRADEYDELIEAPYEAIFGKFLPRVCPALRAGPTRAALVLTKAFAAYRNNSLEQSAMFARLRQRHGYPPSLITCGRFQAPFDFLADQFRGFKGIAADIRRIPDKVKAAAEALLPVMINLGAPDAPQPDMRGLVALHMAPYMSQDHFERLYWPTLEELVIETDRLGVGCVMFAEQDWTRFAEHLETLPKSAVVMTEDGDPARFTETAGKNHVFGGFFDPTMTLAKSEDACIDAAKRLLDTCMKSGHFYFGFNRGVMDIKSVDTRKLRAVLEWVRDNGYY
jgi:hypothetical protein